MEELHSGGPFLATPELEAELHLDATTLAWALFTLPMVVGVVLESVVFAASDHLDRRPVLVTALFAMALGQLAIAAAPGAISLSLAVTFWGIACGVSSGLAETALVADRSANLDQRMARWGLFGAVGDLCAPILFGAVAAAGLGWRASLVLASSVAVVNAWAIAIGPPLPTGHDEEDDEPFLDALRSSFRNRPLLAWLGAATACSLMDEILVAFGALWVRGLGQGPVAQSVQVAAFSAGAVVGLAVTERLVVRVSPRAVLLACSAVCAMTWCAWLSVVSLPAGAALMALLGAATTPLWALATARAYASSPRPGLVAALGNLFFPLEIVAPVALGLVADRWGLRAALLLLLLQPAAVALVAWRVRRVA